MNAPAYPVRICNIRPDFFRFKNLMTQVVGSQNPTTPKNSALGHQIFKSKNGMLSKFKMLSTTANISRTTDELDGGRRIATLLRARRVVGASLRGQTAVGWRELGLRDQEQRTWGAPLRGYVRVDYTAVQQQRRQQ